MAITNFIPTVWSETLLTQLNNKYIAAANCNRSFEGDIKNMGSMVKICGIENITVSDYTKNSDMGTPQTLSDTVIEFPIDRAKYFNFQIDDIDRAQASPKVMEAAMSTAAAALANEADKYIYSLYGNAKYRFACINPTGETLVSAIINAMEAMYQAGVTDPSDIVIELSPYVASILLKAKLELSTNNTAAFENGQFGMLFGAKVFVSKNINIVVKDDDTYEYCLIRTKRSVAFAEQLSEIEAYRPEKRFSDAVKGLHLYGAKVIYPAEFLCLQVTHNM